MTNGNSNFKPNLFVLTETKIKAKTKLDTYFLADRVTFNETRLFFYHQLHYKMWRFFVKAAERDIPRLEP